MIYIVTGDGPRCGSTMLVRSLCKGGMTTICSREHRDVLEVSLLEQRSVGFPQDVYEDHVIKLFGGAWGALNSLIPGDYRVVWLHRPSEERWPSFHRSENDPDLKKWTSGDQKKGREAEKYRDGKSMESLSILYLRPDVEVLELDYPEVCQNPLKAFKLLKKNGWPIDPLKCAEIPEVRA